MDGIILTRPLSSGSTLPDLQSSTTVDAGDTEVVAMFVASPCPSMEWRVSVSDVVTGDTTSLIIHAVHNFSGGVMFNIASRIFTADPGPDFKVDVILNPVDDTMFWVRHENRDVNDQLVCVTRRFQ